MADGDAWENREIDRIVEMIREVLEESGAEGLIVGVSGGVDSAVSLALCARAAGPDRVLGLLLPTAVTRGEDMADARDLCRVLSVPARTGEIEPVLRAFAAQGDTPYVRGNLTARIRMAALYRTANREHRLVCGTSNRSEYLLGYFTKWGDAAADLQPILHLYKGEVYLLAAALGIPDRIRNKVPSAGLWPGQTDEGEIGLTYAEIDAAFASLEAHGWTARTGIEQKVLAIMRRTEHKRLPVPSPVREG
ncbi:MAG: NAD(+) synthase [Methanomicrobiales archaeon]|nr:NAD(+) synthase [Methanomicrobiales archaeon]